MKLILILSALFMVAVVSVHAQYQAAAGLIPQRCHLFDFQTFLPTAEATAKHGLHVLGLNVPGWIHALNYTLMHDHIPGQTTFEDYANNVIYQINGFTADQTGCAFTFDQFNKRAPGHWVLGNWRSEILEDQSASPQLPGEGREPLQNSYRVGVLTPAPFDQAGVAGLKIRSRVMSAFTELSVFNVELPDGTEFPILDESLGVTPYTLSQLAQGIYTGKEVYYSFNIYTPAPHNGFVDWAYGHRVERECAGATGDLAEACECYQRYLAGELTLENDPLAAAAGQTHLVQTCIISAEKRADPSNVQWPATPIARATYHAAAQGHVSYNDQPLRHVQGMPLSKEQHDQAFGLATTEA